MRADFRYLINSSKDTGPKSGWLVSTTDIITGSGIISVSGSVGSFVSIFGSNSTSYWFLIF